MTHFSKNYNPATIPTVSFPSFEGFVPGIEQNGDSSVHDTPSYWLIIRSSDLLVSRKDDTISIPLLADPVSLGAATSRSYFLGRLGEVPCKTAASSADAAAPEGWTFEGVRSLFGTISDSFFSVIARALEIVEWDRTSRFCGSCGAATMLKAGELAMECTACGQLSYPRISPAVIVAILRDEKILLARANRFPSGFYSVLAGFVEPGETLEQCAKREVREETGIEVKNLRYFSSQPWPFPHSLMVAFTAEYAAGEIRIDPSEIADAGWYSADALPLIPDPITVARKLIDWYVGRAR
jgi:NAD+ diphosphatase